MSERKPCPLCTRTVGVTKNGMLHRHFGRDGLYCPAGGKASQPSSPDAQAARAPAASVGLLEHARRAYAERDGARRGLAEAEAIIANGHRDAQWFARQRWGDAEADRLYGMRAAADESAASASQGAAWETLTGNERARLLENERRAALAAKPSRALDEHAKTLFDFIGRRSTGAMSKTACERARVALQALESARLAPTMNVGGLDPKAKDTSAPLVFSVHPSQVELLRWLDERGTSAALSGTLSVDEGDDTSAAHYGGKARAFRDALAYARHEFAREARQRWGDAEAERLYPTDATATPPLCDPSCERCGDDRCPGRDYPERCIRLPSSTPSPQLSAAPLGDLDAPADPEGATGVVCLECGPGASWDEDGCCTECGADVFHDEDGERRPENLAVLMSLPDEPAVRPVQRARGEGGQATGIDYDMDALEAISFLVSDALADEESDEGGSQVRVWYDLGEQLFVAEAHPVITVFANPQHGEADVHARCPRPEDTIQALAPTVDLALRALPFLDDGETVVVDNDGQAVCPACRRREESCMTCLTSWRPKAWPAGGLPYARLPPGWKRDPSLTEGRMFAGPRGWSAFSIRDAIAFHKEMPLLEEVFLEVVTQPVVPTDEDPGNDHT